jgi:acyl-CoA thioester hydrolase
LADTGLRARSELRVRYAETDRMGVVYHANYLVWCEIGRTELIRGLGTSYASLEEDGIMLAVSDASLRFHAPARYDDRIEVETALDEVRSRTITFSYLISRLQGDARHRLVSARTTLVAIDGDGRPQRMPASLLSLFRDQVSHANG